MSEQNLIVNIGADTKQLEAGIAKASNSLKGFQKTTANTGTALTNLSRVVQDAPFGFIAIQNNLDPLIQSFGQLSAQTGGTKQALKALFSSLAGPAGIAFGLAAVSAGITAIIQKYGSLNNALNALAASSNAAAVTQRNLKKALDESTASTTGEVLTVRNLVSALSNQTNAQQVRLNAYESLKKLYPGIIGDMTKENALTSAGAAAIQKRSEELLKYIVLKGKESALIKLIEEQSKKQFELQRQAADDLRTIVDGPSLGGFFKDAIDVIKGGGNGVKGFVDRLAESGKEFKNAGKAGDSYAQTLANIQQQILGLNREIIAPAGGGSKTLKVKVKPELDNFDPGAVESIGADALFKKFRDLLKQNLVSGYTEALKTAGQIKPITQIVPSDEVQAQINNFKVFRFEVERTTQQFNEFLAPAVETVFGALANGATIFDAIKQALKALVVQLGITVAKAAILAGIISAIKGGASAGTGGFFGIFKGLLGIGGGGISAPSFGGIQGGLSGQVVFVQRGSDLVGVLSRTNNRINRVG